MDNKMTKKDYSSYVEGKTKKSRMGINILKAFIIGGFVCILGQFIHDVAVHFGASKELAGSIVAMSLITIAAVLTGLNVFDHIGRFAGAGTAVPITGFANAIVSPAIEFKSEGLILGVGAKMFLVAGPVLVYGVASSIVYGVIYYILR